MNQSNNTLVQIPEELHRLLPQGVMSDLIHADKEAQLLGLDTVTMNRSLFIKLVNLNVLPVRDMVELVVLAEIQGANTARKELGEPILGNSRGFKIPVIKLIRHMTGVGLREAKDLFEAFYAQFRKEEGFE